jgi:hypothetical protein
MDKEQAKKLVRETFENPFNKERFTIFIKNLCSKIDESKAFPVKPTGYIKEAFLPYVETYERIGTYTDPEEIKIDILIVYLKKENTIERARTAQRNFVARYLQKRGEKDAALVAFVSPSDDDWRFSLIKMDYRFIQTENGKVKVKEDFTPARRWSFLVGKNESSHTAQSRFTPIFEGDENSPAISLLEAAFDIETVTKEFYGKYYDLFVRLNDRLNEFIKTNEKANEEFNAKNIDIPNFSEKLLGQIVFLYFLQKKGWFGVGRNDAWGTGPKDFLRKLFEKKIIEYDNFFNDILEPLFYEALAQPRDYNFYSKFNCKIPFLNGGLFDPINNYDWVHIDIILPNELFSNTLETKEGDKGTGILDIFDRYNFTVKEDEPLEKEVAVDPEMLGKVFENLLEANDRKAHGTFYTPREIVHYMCRESLINYLSAELKEYISKNDISKFIINGELVGEHEKAVTSKEKETKDYSYKLPEAIRTHPKQIDEKLASIKACDPACGSGAFLVGMMSEIVKARNILSIYIKDAGGRSLYDFKRECIENSLYGVDISAGAVEIAKLRLWLSLIVDEEDIEQIKPLPNLDYKIMRGNSLLGIDLNADVNFFNKDSFDKLEQCKNSIIEETSHEKKKNLKEEIDKLFLNITGEKKDFDFEVYFSEVFRNNGGFDAVIANPPYLEARNPKFSDKMKVEAQQGASLRWGSDSKFITRGSDLLIYFIELGIYLLAEKGTSVFITQNSWLDTEYGKKFQKFLLNNTCVKAIVDSDFKYFDSKLGPNINTVISIFIGKKIDKNNETIFARYHENFERIEFSILQDNVETVSPQVKIKQFKYTDFGTLKWGTLFLASDELLQIISIMEKRGEYIGHLSGYNISVGQGINLNKSLIINNKFVNNFPFLKQCTIPFMTSEDGSPFVLTHTKNFLIDESKLNRQQIDELKNTGVSLFKSSTTSKNKPILIMPRGITKHFCAMNQANAYSSSYVDIYDKQGNFTMEKQLNLWLFLNSSIAWIIREITGRKNLGGGLLKAEATDLKDIPIYFDFNEIDDINKIYEELKKRQALPTIEEIETPQHKKIDKIVFDYLGVMNNQRKIIIEQLKKHILDRVAKSRT